MAQKNFEEFQEVNVIQYRLNHLNFEQDRDELKYILGKYSVLKFSNAI